jgi:hypothetical protein
VGEAAHLGVVAEVGVGRWHREVGEEEPREDVGRGGPDCRS